MCTMEMCNNIKYRLPTIKQDRSKSQVSDAFRCPKIEGHIGRIEVNPLYVLHSPQPSSEFLQGQVMYDRDDDDYFRNGDIETQCSPAASELFHKIKIVKYAVDQNILSLDEELRCGCQQILNGILKGLDKFEQVQAELKLPRIEYHNFVNKAPFQLKFLGNVDKRQPRRDNQEPCYRCFVTHSLPGMSSRRTTIPRVGGGYRYVTDHLPKIKSSRPITIPMTPMKALRPKFEVPISSLPKKKVRKVTVPIPFGFKAGQSKTEKIQESDTSLDANEYPPVSEGSEELLQKDTNYARDNMCGHCVEESDDSGISSMHIEPEAQKDEELKEKYKRKRIQQHSIINRNSSLSGNKDPENNGSMHVTHIDKDVERKEPQNLEERSPHTDVVPRSENMTSPMRVPETNIGRMRSRFSESSPSSNYCLNDNKKSITAFTYISRERSPTKREILHLRNEHFDAVRPESKTEKRNSSEHTADACKRESCRKASRSNSSRLSLSGGNSSNASRYFSPDLTLIAVGDGIRPAATNDVIDDEDEDDRENLSITPSSCRTTTTRKSDLENSAKLSTVNRPASEIKIFNDEEIASITEDNTDAAISAAEEEDGFDKAVVVEQNNQDTELIAKETKKRRRKKPSKNKMSFRIGPLSKFFSRRASSRNSMESDSEGEDQSKELSMVDFAARFCIVSLDCLSRYEKAFLKFALDEPRGNELSKLLLNRVDSEQKKILEHYDKALFSLDIYQKNLNDLYSKKEECERTLADLNSALEETVNADKKTTLRGKVKDMNTLLRNTERKLEHICKKRTQTLEQKKLLEKDLKKAGLSDKEIEALTKTTDFLIRKFTKLETRKLDISFLRAALKILNINVTEKEILFIQHILQLPKDDSLTFKSFCIVAGLSERVAALDHSVKAVLDQLDLLSLERKFDKCKELFSLLTESSANKDERRTTISLDELAVELAAGGITEDQRRSVLNKMNNDTGTIDFLDFTLYVPLFLMIHDQIIAKPL